MAKQHSVVKSDSFADINSYLQQFDTEGELIESYEPMEISNWIHTGSYIYNAHISGSLMRGYACGKIHLIAGDPKTGKSYLLMNGIRESQKEGYFCLFFETENSPDRERFVKQGIDMAGCRIYQPETVDEIIVKIIQITEPMMKDFKAGKPIPKLMICIDSISGVNSQKQYNDALSGDLKADQGTVAKQWKILWNMLSKRAGKLGIPVICTAHTYDKDMGHYKKKTPSGGMGVIYMASVVDMLKKRIEREDYSGIDITANTFESRYARYNEVHIYIKQGEGMNPYIGLEEHVSWDVCGIDRGKFAELVDIAYEFYFKKIITKDSVVGYKFDFDFLQGQTAKGKQEALSESLKFMIEEEYIKPFTDIDGKGKQSYYFTDKILTRFDENGKYEKIEDKVGIVNKASGQFIVKHLRSAVDLKTFFSAKVFTKEILEKLDEVTIKPNFTLSSGFENTGDEGYFMEDAELEKESESFMDQISKFEQNI